MSLLHLGKTGTKMLNHSGFCISKEMMEEVLQYWVNPGESEQAPVPSSSASLMLVSPDGGHITH